MPKQTRITKTANTIQAGGSHYKDMGVQPWDVIDCWPIEQQIGYHRGNVLKYNMRMGSKDARVKEAEKGLHYQQKLIEVLREAELREHSQEPDVELVTRVQQSPKRSRAKVTRPSTGRRNTRK
jgi:hypothetical protein